MPSGRQFRNKHQRSKLLALNRLTTAPVPATQAVKSIGLKSGLTGNSTRRISPEPGACAKLKRWTRCGSGSELVKNTRRPRWSGNGQQATVPYRSDRKLMLTKLMEV
jgi:hypothetical protein